MNTKSEYFAGSSCIHCHSDKCTTLLFNGCQMFHLYAARSDMNFIHFHPRTILGRIMHRYFVLKDIIYYFSYSSSRRAASSYTDDHDFIKFTSSRIDRLCSIPHRDSRIAANATAFHSGLFRARMKEQSIWISPPCFSQSHIS